MKTKLSAPRGGCGDLGDERLNVQLAIEIERFRLPFGGADAVPEAAYLVDLAKWRPEIAGVRRQPIVELATEGPVRLLTRAPADRLCEPGDRAGIGARQTGDDRIDERACGVGFRREAHERLANRSAGAFCRGGDLVP